MGAVDKAILAGLRPDSSDVQDRLEALLAALRGTGGSPPELHDLDETQGKLRGLVAAPSAQLFDCYHAVAIAYYLAGRADLALDPADDAIAVARQLADRTRLLQALIVSIAASNATLDYPGSIEKSAEATALAHELGERPLLAKTLVNLGAAHQAAGRYGESMEAYAPVRAMPADDEAVKYQRETALSNIAFAALQVHDIKHGIEAINEALSAAQEPRTALTALTRVRLETIHVRLLIENGHFEQARDRARLAKKFAFEFPSAVAINAALGNEALAEIACGNVTGGMTQSRDALEQARPGSDSDLLAMLLVRARACQLAKEPSMALMCLTEAGQVTARLRLQKIKLHHNRNTQRVQRDWETRLLDVEASRRRELEAETLTPEMAQANAAYLEKASIGAELYDDETGLHVFRVGSLARELAQAFGFDPRTSFVVELGARQHDIGKLAVPESIMNKVGKLLPEEWAVIETHTTEGARIINELANGLPQMQMAAQIALGHHEKWGGSGYPKKLKGPKIPLPARITAICDFFDAVTHPRCYRKEVWTNEQVFEHMLLDKTLGDKQHFDPELVDIFVKLVPELIRRHGDLEAYLSAPGKNNTFINDRAAINRLIRGDSGAI